MKKQFEKIGGDEKAGQIKDALKKGMEAGQIPPEEIRKVTAILPKMSGVLTDAERKELNQALKFLNLKVYI